MVPYKLVAYKKECNLTYWHTRFFYKQLSCWGSNVKNCQKNKQLGKQGPTLKTLMQKILVGLWVKLLLFNLKFAEAKFLNNCFGVT